MAVTKRVAVFCAAATGYDAVYCEAARAVGKSLALHGWGIVYGGASVGTMGALVDAALESGGDVIGVMPQLLVDREISHQGLTSLEIVASMAERKARMVALADVFIVLPGGFGTLEEAFEVLSAAQLGAHAKPVIFCNIAQFWSPLIAWFDHAAAQGLLTQENRQRARVVDCVDELVDLLTAQLSATP